MARILVVEDDEQMRRFLKQALLRHRHEVLLAASGEEALESASRREPEAILLDLGLPRASGFDVCRKLRARLSMPILVLSGRVDEEAKITALDMGADDYLTKPFAVAELLARLRSLLRRAEAGRDRPLISSGALQLDLAARRVFAGGREVRLTKLQFEILACLAQKAGAVVPFRAVFEKVWGLKFATDTQTLRVHIGNLRKKIEPHPAQPRYIVTVRGVGYCLSRARTP